MPITAGAITEVTLLTAWITPRPPWRGLSASRSSWASWQPVLAPEGTMARPMAPVDAIASTSTVGRPRESSTCRALSFLRVIMILAFPARVTSSLMVELSLQRPQHLVPRSRLSLQRHEGQPARQLLPGRIEILDGTLAIDAGQNARRRVVDRAWDQALRPPRARADPLQVRQRSPHLRMIRGLGVNGPQAAGEPRIRLAVHEMGLPGLGIVRRAGHGEQVVGAILEVNLGNGAGREQRPQHIERGALGPDPVEPRAPVHGHAQTFAALLDHEGGPVFQVNLNDNVETPPSSSRTRIE